MSYISTCNDQSLICSIHKLKKRAKALGQDAKKVDLTL